MINLNYKLSTSDKFLGGVHKSHNYGHNYQLIYKNFIKNNLNILEIGTASGGFAKFLKDNKIKTSLLVGCDVYFKQPDHINSYNNLYDDFYVGNAFCSEFLKWNIEKKYMYDLIVEDADHAFSTQEYMLKNCDNLLKYNGVYICEDIVNYETAKMLFNAISDEYKPYSYIWDGSMSIGRSDDFCIIIDKR